MKGPALRNCVEIGDCRLYLGDCYEIAPKLNDVAGAAVITDPPYGMNWNTDSTRFTGGRGPHTKQSKRIEGDAERFNPAVWLDYPAVVLFGYHHFAQQLPRGSVLVWLKKNPERLGTILSDCELAWEKGGYGVYAFRCVWSGAARETENGQHYHPTQKPVALMEWCINRNTNPGDMVLDPFAGSGSTGVACVRSGRPFVGIEKDPDYFAVAIQRIKAAYSQEAATLFDLAEAQGCRDGQNKTVAPEILLVNEGAPSCS